MYHYFSRRTTTKAHVHSRRVVRFVFRLVFDAVDRTPFAVLVKLTKENTSSLTMMPASREDLAPAETGAPISAH